MSGYVYQDPATADAARSDYGLADLLSYVNEVMGAEGAKPNRQFLVLLGNQAIRIISRMTEFYYKSWSNAALGGLTLTGNSVPLPTDCIRIDAVEYDGSENALLKWTEAELGAQRPGWRDAVGDPDGYVMTPTSLLLASAPSGATGKLVARGFAYLPDFSDTAGAVNPLALLPSEFQLMPAWYVLSMLPIITANRTKDELQLSIDRRNTHAAMWDEALETMRGLSEQRRLLRGVQP